MHTYFLNISPHMTGNELHKSFISHAPPLKKCVTSDNKCTTPLVIHFVGNDAITLLSTNMRLLIADKEMLS